MASTSKCSTSYNEEVFGAGGGGATRELMRVFEPTESPRYLEPCRVVYISRYPLFPLRLEVADLREGVGGSGMRFLKEGIL